MPKRHLISFVVLTLLGVPTGCHRTDATADAANAGETLVRVTPILPVHETLVRYTEQPGQISAIESAPLYARVSGYVRKVHVDIGDEVFGPKWEGDKVVSAGKKLIEIDVPDLEKELAERRAAVAQAASEIKQAEAAIKVAKAMKVSAGADVDEAKAMVERVDADRQRWQSELDRITDLASRQAVTSKLVDETQNKFRAAAAAGKEIAAKIRSAEAHVSEADALVEKAEADAAASVAKRDVSIAEQERIEALLGYATLYAPFTGVVSERHVDTGHLVNANSQAKEPLLVIVRPETVRVFVDVPEVDAVFIELGAEAQLRVAALSADTFPGKIARTTWVLNRATRTLRTEIDVPNADRRLRPCMPTFIWPTRSFSHVSPGTLRPRARPARKPPSTICSCRRRKPIWNCCARLKNRSLRRNLSTRASNWPT
jgi:HlyD family secretion protein